MWQQLRDDVIRYGIYNQNLQAVPPTGSISYINHATSSIHPIVSKIEIRKEGKTGRVYYPAPFMTNENLALYQDAYEIGPEKIIDTYAEATKHVDQGLSLTLFFPGHRHHAGYQQSADLRLEEGHQNALLHSPAPACAGRHRNRRLRVLRGCKGKG
ncbi:ribonucleotide-diphosphate reductase subunit alpha [Enterobacter asburiae]|uniref:Ribonucleotide-diphosphate reductase subunit alpha n=1 Tax=Enterobacter asburiae TaxID=61645 RepID=A0A376FBG9_ENTAS|nr:ribonucleotide-diphosphate reductase subunit alpha [Enterobacter asburiae]